MATLHLSLANREELRYVNFLKPKPLSPLGCQRALQAFKGKKYLEFFPLHQYLLNKESIALQMPREILKVDMEYIGMACIIDPIKLFFSSIRKQEGLPAFKTFLQIYQTF